MLVIRDEVSVWVDENAMVIKPWYNRYIGRARYFSGVTCHVCHVTFPPGTEMVHHLPFNTEEAARTAAAECLAYSEENAKGMVYLGPIQLEWCDKCHEG